MTGGQLLAMYGAEGTVFAADVVSEALLTVILALREAKNRRSNVLYPVEQSDRREEPAGLPIFHCPSLPRK